MNYTSAESQAAEPSSYGRQQPNQAPSSMTGNNFSTKVLRLQILLQNGTWIKRPFELQTPCTILSNLNIYASEMTHWCSSRRQLCRQLASMVPALIYNERSCRFQTLNRDINPGNACLFDGARLEMCLSLVTETRECGFCFPRSSFVRERDRLDHSKLSLQGEGDWKGWMRREPSDAERTWVNKKGREVLYFLQPPSDVLDLRLSELRADVAQTLGITDFHRIHLSAGPFFWSPESEEDGRGIYDTYFNVDIVIDSQHMLTSDKVALIDVLECTAQKT